ncbi:hypothetical protein Bca4012_095504 [Brassica carinata]
MLRDVRPKSIGRCGSLQAEKHPADAALRSGPRSSQRSSQLRHRAHPRTRYITVGNEVKPSEPAGRILFQAMQNIDKAVSGAGLGIKVSTAIDMGATMDTYPPSHGRFRDDYISFLQPVIDFLYALFASPSSLVNDDQYAYQNLFDANLDAVYAALEKSGGGSLEIVVSESGWPTEGGPGTSVQNAMTYVNNLIQHVSTTGTPRKRRKPIETYIFAMFDENKKGPPELEKFWGMFLPSQQPKYNVNFIYD